MFVALRTAQQQQQAAAAAAQAGHQRPPSAAGAAPSPINPASAASPLASTSFNPQTPTQSLSQPPRQASYGQPAIPTSLAGGSAFASATTQQSPMASSTLPLPTAQPLSQPAMMGAVADLARSGSATPAPATPPSAMGEDRKGKAKETPQGLKRSAGELGVACSIASLG